MTAPAIGMDLDSWVTFADDPEEPCDRWAYTGHPECPNDAVVVILWDVPCDHAPKRTRLCVPHRDEFLTEFHGHQGVCAVCGAVVKFIRMVPIR
jgi:hypothetical protein